VTCHDTHTHTHTHTHHGLHKVYIISEIMSACSMNAASEIVIYYTVAVSDLWETNMTFSIWIYLQLLLLYT